MIFNSFSVKDAIAYSSNTSMANFLNRFEGDSAVEFELAKLLNPITRSGISIPFAAIGYGIEIEELMMFYSQVANKLESSKWSKESFAIE